jgi:hypothetical protein
VKLMSCADQWTVVCGFWEMSYHSGFSILIPINGAIRCLEVTKGHPKQLATHHRMVSF